MWYGARFRQRNLHSRMPLVSAPARFKQWHSSRHIHFLTGSHCKLGPITEGSLQAGLMLILCLTANTTKASAASFPLLTSAGFVGSRYDGGALGRDCCRTIYAATHCHAGRRRSTGIAAEECTKRLKCMLSDLNCLGHRNGLGLGLGLRLGLSVRSELLLGHRNGSTYPLARWSLEEHGHFLPHECTNAYNSIVAASFNFQSSLLTFPFHCTLPPHLALQQATNRTWKC
jgi:hypothetical protein